MRKKVTVAAVAGVMVMLGVGSVALPSAYAVDSTADTTINATIGSVISISTSGTVDLAVTPTASGSASSASDAVSVSTNDTAGYKLQLSSSSTATALTSGSNTIPAMAGTFASPTTMTANSWGFRVDGASSGFTGTTTAQTNASALTGNWAAVPASSAPVTLKTTSTTAASDPTTVWYGATVNATQPNGTYTGTVTYTATAN